MTWQLIAGDCIEVMADMADASVDAIVTDPPYGLHFMGKTWDQFGGPTGRRHTGGNGSSQAGGAMQAGEYDLSVKGQRGFQAEAFRWGEAMLRVLKPGGHLLIFGGTRTYHRLTCALEDAGFEIRDCLAWLYGSGFPKSLDVSKAIDKAAGAEREVVGPAAHIHSRGDATAYPKRPGERFAEDGGRIEPQTAERAVITAPATPDAETWQGWGTALKPAFEPIVLARKPLMGTVAANVLEHGTGALNIDGTRIETDEDRARPPGQELGATWNLTARQEWSESHPAGRWPANVLLDPEAAEMLDEQSGERPAGTAVRRNVGKSGGNFPFGAANPDMREDVTYGDFGGASRFFYTPKADRAERNRGLEHRQPIKVQHRGGEVVSEAGWDIPGSHSQARANNHPTVKPVALMQWLCRLITPPNGTVLDPFTGSGTTGIAALREGFSFIGIEREPEYVEIARDRIIGDAPLFNVGAEA